MSTAEKRALKDNVKPPKKEPAYLKTLAKPINRSAGQVFLTSFAAIVCVAAGRGF